MTRLALVIAAVMTALTVTTGAQTGKPEATSLSGKPLFVPATIPNKQKLDADLAQAEKALAANPKDAEAIIWVGRRLGYLWRYNDAIAMFTKGIALHPDNPKFYRHRGHRYISIRQFAKAQADFEKAAQLIKGKPDEIEPDGAPNPAGKPRSTLQFNIWYHLALSHYLQGNYARAYDAWVECMKVSNNDDADDGDERLDVDDADAAQSQGRCREGARTHHAEDGHPREHGLSPPAADVQGPGETRSAPRYDDPGPHADCDAGLRRGQLLLRDRQHRESPRGVREDRGLAASRRQTDFSTSPDLARLVGRSLHVRHVQPLSPTS